MLDQIDLTKKVDKRVYKAIMPVLEDRLFQVEKASWDAGIPIVILFEGWDASGKGTSIQKLTSSIDPRGYKLYPIRASRTFEKKYPWLWRFWLKLPARGEWAIFDRSWYGRVMVERLEGLIPESEWRRAYREVVEFEHTVADDGTLIIKFFLHISKREQKRRFGEISKNPLDAWHISPEDWEHHNRYDDWYRVYEEAFERTDTEWGQWTIVEATDRRHTWVKIYQTIVNGLAEKLGMTFDPLPMDVELEPGLKDSSTEPGSTDEVWDSAEPSGEDSDDESPYGDQVKAFREEQPQAVVKTVASDEWAPEEPGSPG